MSAPRRHSPSDASTIPSRRVGRSDAAWFGDLAPYALFLLMFIMCCYDLRDTDLYWHLRTGQLIWQRMTIPRLDWYTYMDADKVWIDLHWGFQLLVTAIYTWCGTGGIVVVKSLCYAAVVVIGWYSTGRSLPLWQKSLFWLPAVITISGRALERPETITVLCLALFLWVIETSREHPRRLWILPLITLGWVNCHALFILGFVVWSVYLLEALSSRITPLQKWGLTPVGARASVPTLAAVSILLLIAALLNPYGAEGLKFPIVLYRKFSIENDFYGSRVGEFISPALFVRQLLTKHGWQLGLWEAIKNLYFTSEVIVFLIGALSFVLLLLKRQFSIYRALLFIGFSHLAWVAMRNIAVFSLVTTVMSCANLDQWRKLRNVPDRSYVILANQITTIAMVLLMVMFMTGEWAERIEKWKRFGFREAPYWFGHEAARFAGQEGLPKRAFIAHFGLAGAYIFHNGPDRKVFMDPRLEVCSRETFEKFELIQKQITEQNPEWEKLINPDGQELPAIILDSRYSRTPINGLLMNPRWRLVHADPGAAVFIPTALAEKLQMPTVNPMILHHPPD